MRTGKSAQRRVVRYNPTGQFVKVIQSRGNSYDLVDLLDATIMTPQRASSVLSSAKAGGYAWSRDSNYKPPTLDSEAFEVVKVELEIKIVP